MYQQPIQPSAINQKTPTRHDQQQDHKIVTQPRLIPPSSLLYTEALKNSGYKVSMKQQSSFSRTSCPMKGLCRESSIIYIASLTSEGIAKNYYGCSETEFKTSYLLQP